MRVTQAQLGIEAQRHEERASPSNINLSILMAGWDLRLNKEIAAARSRKELMIVMNAARYQAKSPCCGSDSRSPAQ